MERICRVCKETKDINLFTKHCKSADGYDTICKECNKNLAKEYYYKNKEKVLEAHRTPENLEKKRTDSASRRNVVKNFTEEYKKNKVCDRCGFTESDLLEFHHRNPEDKDFGIAEKNSSNTVLLLEEIKKCILLCPNCHRELHYKKIFKGGCSETTLKRNKYREWFNSLKDKCYKCGEVRIEVLDWHHLRDKKYDIHRMMHNRVSKNLVLEEISKCILVCANCHQQIHRQ